MKIREKRNDLQQEALQALNQQARTKKKKGPGGEDTTGIDRPGEDTVQLDLARAIQKELDPEKMAGERRQRVEELKKLIAEGKYNPPSMAVARSLAQEITVEILGAPPEEEQEQE